VRHVPGLDGLRAIAVIVVVLFHGGVEGAAGGFLGVSLFFTLSGFLITTLLLDEFERTGGVSLRRFYVRRLRRLLPAAYLCLLLVAVWGGWWSAQQQRNLPGDLVAAVANVANWRFAFADGSYADLLSGDAPSPVAHFWSLAIEEQVYLVLPVVLLLALRRGRSVVAATVGTLLVLSVAATLVTADRDLIYNGTHTRAAEVLVGCALAVGLARRRLPDGGWREIPGVTRLTAWAAVGVFGALVAMGSVDQAWVYEGGLPLVGVLSAVLIAAVVTDRLAVSALRPFEARPLVAVGAVSYGIYLFHWPVFLLLDPARTGLDGVALFALRCLVTAALTVASYRIVEQPVRTGRIAGRTPAVLTLVGAGAVAVVLAAVLVVPQPTQTRTEQILALGADEVVDFEPPVTASRLASARSSADATPAERALTESSPVPPEEPSRVVLVVGSDPEAVVALSSVEGIELVDAVRPECLLTAPGSPGCPALPAHVTSLRAVHDPAVVVVAAGAGEAIHAGEQNAAATDAAALEQLGATHDAIIGSLLQVIDESAEAGVAVILSSGTGKLSPFHPRLLRVAVVRPEVGLADGIGALAPLVEEALRPPVAAHDERPLRLLVIGDSTSLSLAQAFNDGGDGALEVQWAGANGCPFVQATAVRSTPEWPWRDVDCEPYETKLPPLLERFRPDAVFLMSGPLEQLEQRYPGADTGYVAGDPVFMAARDAAMASLLGIVGPAMPVLVADFPQVAVGQYAAEEMLDPDRLSALNDQVVRWDERWEQVERFDYRRPLLAAEAAFGTLRTDGVHPDALQIEELTRTTLAPQLLEQVASMRRLLVAPLDGGE
jgi:peptidoglycan/LPS O-acetylase OafA/YrhL